MKRLFLSLAAIAALVSCVEEKGLEPQQPAPGQVTIKAVSADTKTLLDGTNVVWEDTDQIKVVLATGEQQDFTASNVDGANADFTGVFEGSVTGEKAYAVYPSSAVTNEAISFSLDAEQTGVITSGMNLSFAELDVEELAAGTATATFQNALALVKVIVPEGIKSVSLTSSRDALVGNATFYAPMSGAMSIKSTPTGKTVSLSNAGGLEETSYLLVYPGNAETLSLEMVALDGTTYTSTADYINFTASEYRTIDLTKIFKMETADEMFIEPAGGNCPVKITTTADYTYSVEITNNTGNWLSYSLPVKSLHQEEIVFSAEENETGADRTANVTITWGDDHTRSFKITQKNIYMDFVNDENGDPIQWEESFGLYSDESLSSELTTFTKNVFTIGLSDDYTKGTYIIKNLFKVDRYNDANLQPVQNKGGEYYANFNAEKSELTVLKVNSVASYTLPENGVVLKYDSANKIFSVEKFEAAPLYGSAYYEYGSDRYIGNYTATVKVEEPESGDVTGVEALYGTYNESVKAPYSSSDPETLVISESDDASYDLKMLFFYTEDESSYSYETAYGKVSEDGKTITVTIPGMSNYYGPVSDFTLTVDGTTISGSYCGQMDYSATK